MPNVNPLQAALALALLFFVPGYLLVKALLPRRRLSAQWHVPFLVALSVTLSAALTVLVGSALGFLGRFEGAATGRPVLEGALAGLALLLFAIALARGAFPRLARRALGEGEPLDAGPDPAGRFPEVRDLRAKEARLARDGADPAALAETRARIRALEEEATRERYG